MTPFKFDRGAPLGNPDLLQSLSPKEHEYLVQLAYYMKPACKHKPRKEKKRGPDKRQIPLFTLGIDGQYDYRDMGASEPRARDQSP